MKNRKRVRGLFSFTLMFVLLVVMVVDLANGCKPFSRALYVFFALLSLLIAGVPLHKRLRYMERETPLPRNRYNLTQHWSFWVMVAGSFLISVFLIFSPPQCPWG
jgi:hypothetical protein